MAAEKDGSGRVAVTERLEKNRRRNRSGRRILLGEKREIQKTEFGAHGNSQGYSAGGVAKGEGRAHNPRTGGINISVEDAGKKESGVKTGLFRRGNRRNHRGRPRSAVRGRI